MKAPVLVKSLVAALILATPLAAQDRMTQDQCDQSLVAVTALVDLAITAPVTVLDNAGWCVLTGLEFNTDPRTKMQIAMLRWRASDVDRLINDGLPPRSFEVEGKGVGVVPETGDAVFDYLLRLQMSQTQLGFGAALRWDGLQNALMVDTAYIDFSPDNRIEATARLEGLNLTDMASIQTSMGTVGLRDLTIQSQVNGWFETYAVMILGPLLLQSGDETPEAQVTALQDQASDIINEFPDAFMPEASRTALTEFITALPTPRGTAQLQLSADPTLGATRALLLAAVPNTPSATQVIETALDGVAMLFTWTPTGDAE